MPEPVLVREVELPRSRSSGAAVVLIASLAMFTAVGASAFVVRVRMREACAMRARAFEPPPPPAAPPSPVAAAAPSDEAGDILPVSLISREDLVRMEPISDAEQPLFYAYLRASADRDVERALDIYQQLSPLGAAAYVLKADRDRLAQRYFEQQGAHLARELDRGDCDLVKERLRRMARLLPERAIPRSIDGCP